MARSFFLETPDIHKLTLLFDAEEQPWLIERNDTAATRCITLVRADGNFWAQISFLVTDHFRGQGMVHETLLHHWFVWSRSYQCRASE